MSWSGFKKNVGRATTQVMMKTGHVEKTSDREYEVEERRYRTLESASLRLQKEAKGYLDSLRAMTASQMRIAETIDAFYGDSGARDGVSRSYKQAVEDLDAETIKALDGPYRCVPDDLRKYAWDDEEGVEDVDTLRLIEWEMNYGNIKSQTAQVAGQFREYDELMDYVYRTTVLEPINRFCAYFPDINECIKKRNHKMLDYDSLRSRVKRLTEKPDKDPAKLPRTEKELEMVSHDNLPRQSSPPIAPPDMPMDAASKRLSRKPIPSSTASTILPEPTLPPDLDIVSPPKALNGLWRSKRQSVISDSDTNKPVDRKVPRSLDLSFSSCPIESPEGSPTLHTWIVQNAKHAHHRADASEGSLERASPATRSKSSNNVPYDSTRLPPTSHAQPRGRNSTSSPSKASKRLSLSSLMRSTSITRRSDSTTKRTPSFQMPSHLSSSPSRHSWAATPFFSPSELEDTMRPLKEKFMCEETDALAQAKTAYDQLNDQLTSELPQLIDLRVPYLDPSFEALVKIQLRFCAEAYSRMAQVQQYLDASTRDSYASGELDAKVEDVLGQIRELSIAGTV